MLLITDKIKHNETEKLHIKDGQLYTRQFQIKRK